MFVLTFAVLLVFFVLVAFLVTDGVCLPVLVDVPPSVAVAAVIAVVAVFVIARAHRLERAVILEVAAPVVESILVANLLRPSPSFFPAFVVAVVEKCIGRRLPAVCCLRRSIDRATRH